MENTPHSIFQQTNRQRVSDGEIVPILSGCESCSRLLVIVCPQLGDFDSLEYAWWLQRERQRLEAEGVAVRMVGIGDRASGRKFCDFTKFPAEWLFIDRDAKLHTQLDLYPGLSLKLPGFSTAQNAWLNLMLMCAGIGSPGRAVPMNSGQAHFVRRTVAAVRAIPRACTEWEW